MEQPREMVLVERRVVGSPAEINQFIDRAGERVVQYSRAIEISPGRYAIKARVFEPNRAAVPRAKPVPRRPSVAGEMAKALAFVGALLLILVVVGIVAYLTLRNSFDADAVKAWAAGALLVAGLILFATNRANHSGTCPGIAVHCKGCRR